MVILLNLSNNPFKIEYTNGSRAFIKVIPSNKFVAMKSLNVTEQITNRVALSRHGVTILDYEKNVYYYRNPATSTGATLGFEFVGNNVKPDQHVKFSATSLTAGFLDLKALM